MAVKKKFPYRAAVVACNGGCRSAEGEAGCADGCIGCKACINVNSEPFPSMSMVWRKWMRRNALAVVPARKSARRK